MDIKLQVVVVPVADVNRAKNFYKALGWREDADYAAGEDFRVVHTPMQVTFDSTADLGEALRRTAAAHGRHEEQIGRPDLDWPDWYAQYRVPEQAGPGANT